MVKKLLMGNEAFAHAALEAGVRVVAGYPGTPSSELIETIAAEHAAGRAHGVHVEWSCNEKAALELLAGAAYCGARVLFTCKQVGLNVASDALMSLNYVGVKGGTVLFVADDPGPISSQTEQDTRRFAAFAKVPVLDPATPEQGFAMMKAAFDLSERYRTPVIVRPTTRIDHASTFFDVAEETYARPVPEVGFERDSRWVIFPKRAWEAHGEINDRLRAIAHDFATDPALATFNPVFEVSSPVIEASSFAIEGGVIPSGAFGDAADGDGREEAGDAVTGRKMSLCDVSHETFGCDSSADAAAKNGERRVAPRLGIMAGGVSAAYAREALAMLESRSSVPAYRFIQVGTPYPFPEEAVVRFVEGLDAVLVLEELDHVLEDELLAFAGRTHAAFDVFGKLTGHARDRGENDVDDIAARIQAFFAALSPRTLSVPATAPSSLQNVSRETFCCNFDGKTIKLSDDSAGLPGNGFGIGSVSRETSGGKEEGCSPQKEVVEAFDLPTRPPVLCAGCPHRGSFYAVKRALGKREAVLCGDIGCYTLGNAKPLDAVDTCLCMGAGITMAQGFAVAEPQKKQVAFVGDSTFFASGMTGVANAVYNGHDITVAVLDNATTAMTGGQPHPGTGITLMGPRRKPISIEAVLRALGVECIVHANPLNLDESTSAAREAIDFTGPSAVLFESPCVQLVRPAAPARVNVNKCTGCKKCITEIGCLAIGFTASELDLKACGDNWNDDCGQVETASSKENVSCETFVPSGRVDVCGQGSLTTKSGKQVVRGKRGLAFVDSSLCNGCSLCTQVCPFGALQTAGDERKSADCSSEKSSEKEGAR